MVQSALILTEKPRFSGLTIGKVTAVYPEANMVDIILFDGSIYKKVQVMTSFASSRTGSAGLPLPIQKNDSYRGNNNNPFPTARQDESDIFAVVGFVGGSTIRPLVFGFLFPEESEILCSKEDQPGNQDGTQFLWKHESNVYARVVKGAGRGAAGYSGVSGIQGAGAKPAELEISHPSGLFIKIGGDDKLTPINNYDKKIRPFKFKNPETNKPDPAPYAHLYHPSGTKLTIKPNGDVEITVEGDVTHTITGDVTEEVDGNVTRTIKGNLIETIQGSSTKKINQSESKTVKGSQTEKVTGGVTKIAGSIQRTIKGSVTETAKASWKRSAKGTLEDSAGGFLKLNATMLYNKASTIMQSGGITQIEPSGGGVGGAGGIGSLAGIAMTLTSAVSQLTSIYTAIASGNILGVLTQMTGALGLNLQGQLNSFLGQGFTVNLTSLNLAETGSLVLSNFTQNVMGSLPLNLSELGNSITTGYLGSWANDILNTSGLGISSGDLTTYIGNFTSGLDLSGDIAGITTVLTDIKTQYGLSFDPATQATALLSGGMSKLDLQPVIGNYINGLDSAINTSKMLLEVSSFQDYCQDNYLEGTNLFTNWTDTVLTPLSITGDLIPTWGQVQGQFNVMSIAGDKMESLKDSGGSIVSGSDTVKQTVDNVCRVVRPVLVPADGSAWSDDTGWVMDSLEHPLTEV